MNDKKNPYKGRAKRMVERWVGERIDAETIPPWKSITNEARFEDSVGIFPEFLDGYNVLILPTTGRYFQVPYGCLVPQSVDNLLV